MSLTPEQLASMTIGEFEALAQRVAGAAAVLREALGLGLVPGGSAVGPSSPATALPPAAPAPSPGIGMTNKGPIRLSPSEMAERAKLMRQNVDAGMPPDIAAAEAAAPPQEME